MISDIFVLFARVSHHSRVNKTSPRCFTVDGRHSYITYYYIHISFYFARLSTRFLIELNRNNSVLFRDRRSSLYYILYIRIQFPYSPNAARTIFFFYYGNNNNCHENLCVRQSEGIKNNNNNKTNFHSNNKMTFRI